MSLINRATLKKLALVVGVLFYFTACDFPTESTETEENYNLFQGLEKVDGADKTKVTINQGSAVGRDAYFEFEVDNVNSNLIAPGVYDGWCIEWTKSIAQQGDTHENLQAYSTYGQEKYKPLNYFLNIKDQLKAEDPELTFREFQAVIWSVTEGPEFNLNDLSNDELPPRLMKDGEPNFSKEKVNTIVSQVRANAPSFEYTSNTQFALFMKTGDDEQDVMVPGDPPEDPEEETVSHGYVEGVTPSDDPQFAERTYPVVQADWEGPGGDKRWLGWNLGATDAPESFTDDDPDRAGWYFYFNDEQGHFWNGEGLGFGDPQESDGEVIPDTGNEGEGLDPCSEALGGSWRTPTVAEWQALADADVTDEMQFHESGALRNPTRYPPSGVRDLSRYWTSERETSPNAHTFEVNSDGDVFQVTINLNNDTNLYPVRCIED